MYIGSNASIEPFAPMSDDVMSYAICMISYYDRLFQQIVNDCRKYANLKDKDHTGQLQGNYAILLHFVYLVIGARFDQLAHTSIINQNQQILLNRFKESMSQFYDRFNSHQIDGLLLCLKSNDINVIITYLSDVIEDMTNTQRNSNSIDPTVSLTINQIIVLATRGNSADDRDIHEGMQLVERTVIERYRYTQPDSEHIHVRLEFMELALRRIRTRVQHGYNVDVELNLISLIIVDIRAYTQCSTIIRRQVELILREISMLIWRSADIHEGVETLEAIVESYQITIARTQRGNYTQAITANANVQHANDIDTIEPAYDLVRDQIL
jgi:hypothetical protein